MSRIARHLAALAVAIASLLAVADARAEMGRGHAPAVARDGKAPARAHGALSGVVNLNQADEPALELLPGIGPARAQAILEYRKAHPFKRVEDLARIRGIGKKTLARLKPYLAVAGPTTLSDGKGDAQPAAGDGDGAAEAAHP